MRINRTGAERPLLQLTLSLLIFLPLFFWNGGSRTVHTIDLLAREPGYEYDSDLPNLQSSAGTGINGLYRVILSSRADAPERPRSAKDAGNEERLVSDSRDTNAIPRYEGGKSRPGESASESAPRVLLPEKTDPDASLSVEIPPPPKTRSSLPNNPKERPRKSPPAAARPAAAMRTKREEPKPSKDTRPDSGKNAEPESGSDAPVQTVTGYPRDLEPTPRTGYRYVSPAFYRGIYINNATARSPAKYRELIEKGKEAGLNTLVVDVQPELPPIEFIRLARTSDYYLVARVVVFQGGLKRYPPSRSHLQETLDTAEFAAKNGFMEIQFDYIRFADRMEGLRVPLKSRYHLIAGILKMATDRLHPLGVPVGADVFGRIAFNKDDTIGQKLEVFAPHLDTIYPMLYPSHFYGEPQKIRNPYLTVKEGVQISKRRVGDTSRIVAYIQGFKMSINKSGLSLTEYIRKQIEASENAGGGGFIVWNASNHYAALFQAMREEKHKTMSAREENSP